ncbi:hypothetical protein HC256_003097 [Beauveria bassiana]|nr:hypothetical protein HC256_003097 [Beauveria bassiana]
MSGKTSSSIDSSWPKLQLFSSSSASVTEGLPNADDSNTTRTVAPTATAAMTSRPATCTVLYQRCWRLCRYHVASPKMTRLPARTATPAQDPVAAVVADEGEERGVVGGHGEQGQHPDEEEVVGHEGAHLGEGDGLHADALDDLRVAEAVEELAPDGRGAAANLGEDDAGGEDEGEAGGDDEGEEDLWGKQKEHTPAPATPGSLGA